jgi:hypothetical protein
MFIFSHIIIYHFYLSVSVGLFCPSAPLGDMIHISNVESGTALEGSVGWTVNNVTLFETEMTWLPTMERCSISNGSLANSRIINWARSPTARFVILLIFPIDTPYDTLEIFKVAVEEYLKARPREWLALNAFRVNYLQGERAWMRIEVVVQHREPWQNVGTVLDSKGNFMSYCTEVQKMLGIQYKAPHVPIELTTTAGAADGTSHNNDPTWRDELLTHTVPPTSTLVDGNADPGTGNHHNPNDVTPPSPRTSRSQSDVFRSMAQAKHNIRV